METFIQSVARSFASNREALPQVELAILLLLALLALIQVAGVVRRLLARRSSFRSLLLGAGLGPEEVRFGKALAARAGVNPLQLVTHLEVFERATALALHPDAPGSGQAPGQVRRLRHALGFDRLAAHVPLLSSRELPAGTALEVASQPGTIAEVDETGFTVEVRDPPVLPAGQPAELTLVHAREARYHLACRLEAAHRQPGGGWHLRFGHDEHPARQQQRDHARIPVTGTLTLHPLTSWSGVPAPPGQRLQLVDLSGGGAQAVGRAPLAVGTLVRAAFEVGGLGFVGLRAVVLSCEPSGDGRHRLHLEFTGRPGSERERLVAALTQLELRERAASRS